MRVERRHRMSDPAGNGCELRKRVGKMKCRTGCGACCVVPSISSPIPGMPDGKPAFTPCIHFDAVSRRCAIWMTGEYPAVCREFTPTLEYCGTTQEEAVRILTEVENFTAPGPK